MAACQADVDPDWSVREFHKRNKKNVELGSTLFADKLFRSNSKQNVIAHACDVFRLNFFAFR